MIPKGVMVAAKYYHIPGQIAISFVSSLLLGWKPPYKYKLVGLEALKGQSTINTESPIGRQSLGL